MLKIDLYNQEGEKKGEVTVSEEIFGVKFKKDLLHQALVRQHSNARLGMIAHTKTKGEVRGGGRKPFRQKGTGRARQGSTRNPHWVGGGVSFGPRNNRNFTRMMPKKQRRLALFSALSAKLNDKKIMAIDDYKSDVVKTKKFMEMLHRLPIEKDVLIVIPQKNETVQKSSRNLPFVKTLLVNYMNIADLQKYDIVLFFEESLKKMEQIFLSKK
ncbi:MAG TPA: 50S ribosomal protein L4 [Candidatus Gracilibacteria bacterium]|nr:50S ribosomal protein L4 [Candidatus Gracilibacteria bacterium]